MQLQRGINLINYRVFVRKPENGSLISKSKYWITSIYNRFSDASIEYRLIEAQKEAAELFGTLNKLEEAIEHNVGFL